MLRYKSAPLEALRAALSAMKDGKPDWETRVLAADEITRRLVAREEGVAKRSKQHAKPRRKKPRSD